MSTKTKRKQRKKQNVDDELNDKIDESFKKLEDILLKLKNVNKILDKEKRCDTLKENKVGNELNTKRKEQKVHSNTKKENRQSESRSDKKQKLKKIAQTKRSSANNSSIRKKWRTEKILVKKEKQNEKRRPDVICKRTSNNRIVLDFSPKPKIFQNYFRPEHDKPTHKEKESSPTTKTKHKYVKAEALVKKKNKKSRRNTTWESQKKRDSLNDHILAKPEDITFLPSHFSFHSTADDISSNLLKKDIKNDTDLDLTFSKQTKKEQILNEKVNQKNENVIEISDKKCSHEIVIDKIGEEKGTHTSSTREYSFTSVVREKNELDTPINIGNNLMPQAKSENNVSNFLSTHSASNKDTKKDKSREKIREKPETEPRLTCSDIASSSAALLTIVKSFIQKTTEEVAKIEESDFYDCSSLLADAEVEKYTSVNGEPDAQSRNFESCVGADLWGDNMTEIASRSEEFGRSGASTGNKQIKSPTSKRRESTSPDEGIAHSPAEMEYSPTSTRKKLSLAEVDEKNEDRTHIAITIKGGLQRDPKIKKKSGKQHKSSSRRKNTLDTNDVISTKEKGNGHVINLGINVTNRNGSHKVSKKKSGHQKTTRMSEKTVARNVVKSALIENSMAKKKKPLWVEITKENPDSKQSESRRERDKTKQKDIQYRGITNNYKEAKKLSEKIERRTKKSSRPGERIRKPIPKYEVREVTSKSNLTESKVKRYRPPEYVTNAKVREVNRHLTKSDIKRDEAPRIMRHRTPGNEKAKEQSRRRRRRERSKDNPGRHRSVSADSSVRDLSYSSSSSESDSSSKSEYSSTNSRTESSVSSYSSTSSSTSSSGLSSPESTNSSAPQTSLKKSGDYNDEEVKRSKPKKKTVKKEEMSQATAKSNHHRYKRYDKHRRERVPSYDIVKKEDKSLDMKSLQKVTKDIEKTLEDEEQEFEVNLERRRNRNRRHNEGSDDITKDPQKTQWAQHRLVLTSQRPGASTTNVRVPDKTRQVAEPTTASKQKSFEASTKDNSGAVLTIRDLYSLHHVLSDTQNGTVIAGHRRSDGMRVAIKRIAKSGTTRWGWMNGKVVPLELALICQVNEVRHSGVVEIVEWHETTEAFLLVMVRPHPSVDLYDHVTKQQRLKESVARRIIKQLVSSILHCHKMGVLHRDVKLENILYNPDTMETILIDFGCGDYHRAGPYKEFAGTPEYYPPEWFLCKQYCGDPATVWSIGVLMYSLLCGTLPFRSSKDIINKELTKYPAEVSRTARHLISQSLQKNSRERIDLKSIISHPWFKSSKDHLRKTSV